MHAIGHAILNFASDMPGLAEKLLLIADAISKVILWISELPHYLIEGFMAFEEFIRWASPVMTFRRTAAKDVEIGGQAIRAGEKVVMFYASGNYDTDVFEHPERLDLSRNPNPHVGFGAIGPHFCLGAPLARIQIDVMFRQLFERLPDIESVGEPDRLRSTFINGIKHLGCAFTPMRTRDRTNDPERE